MINRYGFGELRYWSAIHGRDVLRLALWGADGSERHMIVPMDGTSRENRERRLAAMDQLTVKVRKGVPAGEVALDDEPQGIAA